MRMRQRVVFVVVAVVALVAAVAGIVAWRHRSGREAGSPPPVVPGFAAPAAPVPSSAVPPAIAAPDPAAAPGSVTVAAVGDLVCDPGRQADDDGDGSGPRQCQQRAVSDLVLERHPAALLALGDTQYSRGTFDAYLRSYDPTYGRLLDITHPVPGNHEYETPGAAGYFAYFGRRAGTPGSGYYSYDLGAWHVVALNSNCGAVSCEAGGEQERWLRADLAAHPATCTLAYWHHPRWSHGEHGDDRDVAPLVRAAYDAGVELILTGHDHDYERYVPRSPSGDAEPGRGVREFVVGTGGRNLRTAHGGEGTEAVDSDTFGALFLTLSPAGYSWRFTPVGASRFSDHGSDRCH